MVTNFKLNPEQSYIKKIVREGHSIFFTGPAGSGKSFLLRELIIILQKKYGKSQVGITSTTGTGADIITGATLASFFGLGLASNFNEEVLLASIYRSFRAKNNWKKIEALVIDEVSMLEGELFDKLESMARRIRRNNKPFGGIQLILVGDFCQLPPVNKTNQPALYCFEARSWLKCLPFAVSLTQIYRQKESWFTSYLNDIRFGRLSRYRWKQLISWKSREPAWPQDGIEPVSLFATKSEMGDINKQELDKLAGDCQVFLSRDQESEPGKLKELVKGLLAPEKLELKVGAQVMLITNSLRKKLVNGSQGIVTGFKKNLPQVKFTNGQILTIKKHTWKKIEGYGENNKPIVTAIRQQIPLILAWAITIHKSQGQTIERLKVDLSKCFLEGQIYVALSRCSEPKYLQIVNFPYQRLWCNSRVKKFYQFLEQSEEDNLPVKKKEKLAGDSPVKKRKKKISSLQRKVQKKWKELAIIDITTSDGQQQLRTEIKQLLSQEKQEFFEHFCAILRKAISNKTNLVFYTDLTNYLQEWWEKEKNNNII